MGFTHFSGPLAVTSTAVQTATSGVLPVDVSNILLETTGVSALTLPDGQEGQQLFIGMSVNNGDVTITPDNGFGWSSAVYNSTSDSSEWLFIGGRWAPLGNRGVTINT